MFSERKELIPQLLQHLNDYVGDMPPSQINAFCKGLNSLRQRLNEEKSQCHDKGPCLGSPQDSSTDLSNLISELEGINESLFEKSMSVILPLVRTLRVEDLKNTLNNFYDRNYYDKNSIAQFDEEIELRLSSLDHLSTYKVQEDCTDTIKFVDLEHSQPCFEKQLALQLGWCKRIIQIMRDK